MGNSDLTCSALQFWAHAGVGMGGCRQGVGGEVGTSIHEELLSCVEKLEIKQNS